MSFHRGLVSLVTLIAPPERLPLDCPALSACFISFVTVIHRNYSLLSCALKPSDLFLEYIDIHEMCYCFLGV